MITMSEFICLICNIQLDTSSCINIFSTSLPHNGELLASYVLKMLRLVVSDLHSSYVCPRCYNLFQMLEQAQWNVTNICCEILKVYHAGVKEKATVQVVDDRVNLLHKVAQEQLFVQSSSINAMFKESKYIESLSVCSNKISDNVKDTLKKNKCLCENVNISYNEQNMKDRLISTMRILEPNCPEHNKNEQCIPFNMINASSSTSNSNACNIDQLNHDKNKNKKVKASLETTEVNSVLCNSTGLSHNSLSNHNDAVVLPDNANNFSNKKYVHSSQKLAGLDNTNKCKNEYKEENETDKGANENLRNIAGNIFNKCNSFDNVQTEENTNLCQASWKPERMARSSSKTFKHACSMCGKKWRTLTELKTHIKSHSTLRPYMCEKCGQAYKHKHALEIHVGMHNGINPFQCNFCKKCFTQKGALMRHLPMHTGEMPYQCELCGKRFVHHTSYNMHALSHTGKKSYQCHVCDLSLLSTSHLKRHMRVHTGEKPYSCALCGKRFAERYNLFAHQKIHDPTQITVPETKEMQFMCDQCDLQFNTKQKLNDHFKRHPKSRKKEDAKKLSEQVIDIPAETVELSTLFKIHDESHNTIKHEDIQNRLNYQIWPQINGRKLHDIDNETKVILFQNSLSDTDANSVAITFNDHKVSLEDARCNSNLQSIIERSSIPRLSSNPSNSEA